MGVNTEIDYEKIRSVYIKALRDDYAKKISNCLEYSFDELGKMKKSWHGVRYNTVISEFNRLIPRLNELIKLVMKDVPDNLDIVYVNEISFEKQKKIPPIEYSTRIIKEVGPSNEAGRKFVEAQVIKTRDIISNYFKDALNKLEGYKSKFDEFHWTGEAASSWKRKINELKELIRQDFNKTIKFFNDNIDAAVKDAKGTETADTMK